MVIQIAHPFAVLGVWIVTLCVLPTTAATAQRTEALRSHPLETADTTSPRATLTSFLDTLSEMHRRFFVEGRTLRNDPERQALANRALRCLDMSEVPESIRGSVGREAAVYLKETLDRLELPPEDTWPDVDQVTEDELTRWTIANTEITIGKVTSGDRTGDFLFTAATVKRASEFYELASSMPYQDREGVTPEFARFYLTEPGWMIPRAWVHSLPSRLHTRYFGQAIWQWIALVITLILAFGLMLGIYVLGGKRAETFRSSVSRYVITVLFPLTAMVIPWLAIYFIGQHIRVSGTTFVVTSYLLRIVFLLALIVVILGAGNRVAALILSSTRFKPRGLDAQLVRLICRVISIVAAIFAFLEGGQQFGIPLTTLLASAGVGGLAVALAAQDTLKNIFGSIMITFDKPFAVGERIVTKGYDGFVEEIGLRSTKIRLLSGHQASIPNDELARCDIENIGRRPHIRRTATIELPAATPVAQVKRALEIVREAVENHEGIDPDRPPRAYLRDFNDASIGIFLIYWFHPPHYWDFLAMSERINLQVMERFEADGIPFALPVLNVDVAGDGKNRIQLGGVQES